MSLKSDIVDISMNDRFTLTKELFSGASIIFFGILLTYILKFFYRIIVSRYLGPEGYGLLSLGDMVMNVGYLIALIGLDVGLIRHIAHFREKKEISKLKGSFWGTIIISTIISCTLIIFALLFSEKISLLLFHNIEFAPLLIIFSFAIPFSIFMRIISQATLAFEKPLVDVGIRVIARDIIGFVLMLSIIWYGGGVIGISLAYLVSLIMGVIIGYIILEKKVFPFFKNSKKSVYEYKKRIKFALPLFFSAVFINVMLWADTFFLGFFGSIAEVGIYNVALPLAAALGIFLASFSRVFYPMIAKMIASEKLDAVAPLYVSASKWILLFSLPIVILILFFPVQIISVLFGTEYLGAAIPLMLLTIAYFINILVGPTTETLISLKKNKTIFLINTTAVIFNILLNIMLIPLYGVTGAAIATLTSFALREIISFVIVRKLIFLKIPFYSFSKIFFSGILGITTVISLINIFSVRIESEFFYIVGVSLILGVFYVLSLLITKAFTKEDKLLIKKLLNRLNFF